ncbi:MAG: carbohydrate ABC transporter permease, partial [Oscillospiraceae bacterium]
MVKNNSLGLKVFNVFNIILMGVLAFSCFYPLWYALCLSISNKVAANSGLVTFYPIGFSLASYGEIMGDLKFFNSFWISIQRTVLGTAVSLLAMILMSYPMSKTKKEFGPRNIVMWVVLFCMVFTGGTIPWYLTIKSYGLIDS